MRILSLLFRAVAILSMGITLVFFIYGGRQLKKYHLENTNLCQVNDSLSRQQVEATQDIERLRQSLQHRQAQLDEALRERQVWEGQSLIAKKEIDRLKKTIEDQLTTAGVVIAERDTLARETIQLQARLADPGLNPEAHKERIRQLDNRILSLEAALQDAWLVINDVIGNPAGDSAARLADRHPSDVHVTTADTSKDSSH